MRLLTITGDWTEDLSAYALFSATIESQFNNFKIIKLTSFENSLTETAIFFRFSYKKFPEGTIHIIASDDYKKSYNSLLLTQVDNRFFITRNNGMIALIFPYQKLTPLSYAIDGKSFFPELEAVPQILKDIVTNNFSGTPVDKINRLFIPGVVVNNDYAQGNVIYFKKNGNIVSNFDEKILKGKKISVLKLKGFNFKIYDFKDFLTLDLGSNYAFVNENGFLELGIKNENLRERLNIKLNDEIRLEFSQEFRLTGK